MTNTTDNLDINYRFDDCHFNKFGTEKIAIEIAKIIKALEIKDTSPGAITIATKLVNIESDITLGLRREK